MPQRSDKWIRSIRENPSGKVVADKEGNRWEWDSEDETSRLLEKLENDDLAIESTDLRPVRPRQETRDDPLKRSSRRGKTGERDSGGGFDPYDHAGKPKPR